MAAFHRGNENSYDILEWDVDVEERLLEHLQREALAKGTEDAVRDYKDQLDSIKAHEPAASMQTDPKDSGPDGHRAPTEGTAIGRNGSTSHRDDRSGTSTNNSTNTGTCTRGGNGGRTEQSIHRRGLASQLHFVRGQN